MAYQNQERLNRVHGALAGYIVLRGIHSTVLSGLQEFGASHPVNGENPISFCNIFFFSSLSVGLYALVKDKSRSAQEIKDLNYRCKALVVLDAFLGCVSAPIAYYLTLLHLNVSIQTMLFSLVLPLSALMGRRFNQEALPKKFWLSSGLIAGGLIPIAMSKGGGEISLNSAGLAWAAVAILSYSASSVTSRKLSQSGLGTGVIVGLESLSAAVVFAVIALWQFGPQHFIYLEWWWVAAVIGGYALALPLGIRSLLVRCYRQWSVASIGIWSSLCVPIAIVSAALLLRQTIPWAIATGSLLTVIGIATGQQTRTSAHTSPDRVIGE